MFLVGRVILELFVEESPRTCENFRVLCTGENGYSTSGTRLCYKDTPFHQIIKDFMIQGGDITHKDGMGGESIYGKSFDDENLKRNHDQPGLLSMANRGPSTNNSQFFITTQPCSHLDGKHVVFGRVIDGMETIYTIEALRVDASHKPFSQVTIGHCGELVPQIIKKSTQESKETSDIERDKEEAMKEKKKKKKKKKRQSRSPSEEIRPTEIETNDSEPMATQKDGIDTTRDASRSPERRKKPQYSRYSPPRPSYYRRRDSRSRSSSPRRRYRGRGYMVSCVSY
jgi:peptidyl-prolyl isomerase G (cyclophilin G)